MAIVMTLTSSDFVDAFNNSSRGGSFTYEQLLAIFDYLDNQPDDSIEFDPIAICCEFSGYNSALEALEDCYRDDYEGIEEEEQEEREEEALRLLNKVCSMVLACDDGSVVIINE